MRYIKLPISRFLCYWRLRKSFPQSLCYFGVTADRASWIGRHAVLFPDVSLVNSKVGAYSYVQTKSNVYNTEIGPFCSIAANVSIGLAAHPTFMVSSSPVFYDNTQPLPFFFTDKVVHSSHVPKTTIGADVWIGQGALIKAGIKIGTGAVIGAGSIVTRDVPEYTIVAGSPAKTIRLRFPVDIAQRLLLSKWWEFDDSILKELCPLFENPELFLSRVERMRV